MKKIRTGNDIHLIWTITKNDEILESKYDLNLEGAEVLLIDSFNHPATFEYAITTIDENTAQVVGTFFGKDQKTQGKYRLLLVKNKGEEGMITLDFVDAFILTCVSKFGVMSGNDESSITTATIELNSQFSSYNGSPDMTGYYTKEECENEFVHKSEQWAKDNPVGETIYGYKSFTGGSVEFNGYSVTLPDTDLIYLEYGGLTLKDYVEGQKPDIKIDNNTIKKKQDDEIVAVDAKLEDAIQVQGVNVGNLTNGTVIAAGTKVSDIFKSMLQKVIDVKANNPTNTLKINGTSNSGILEIGTVINPQFSVTYTDGTFTGDTGYSYTLNAGCSRGTSTVKIGSSVFATLNNDSQKTTATYTLTNQGTTTFTTTTTYGASTNIPKKNNGTDSNVRIEGGTTKGNSQSYTSYYKYFVGCYNTTSISNLTSNIVRALNITNSSNKNSSGWCEGDTTTNTNEFSSTGYSIIIACPSGWSLNNVQNSLGASIKDNFSVTGNLTVNIGGSTTNSYNIYLYPITNGAIVSFKNVSLTKS